MQTFIGKCLILKLLTGLYLILFQFLFKNLTDRSHKIRPHAILRPLFVIANSKHSEWRKAMVCNSIFFIFSNLWPWNVDQLNYCLQVLRYNVPDESNNIVTERLHHHHHNLVASSLHPDSMDHPLRNDPSSWNILFSEHKKSHLPTLHHDCLRRILHHPSLHHVPALHSHRNKGWILTSIVKLHPIKFYEQRRTSFCRLNFNISMNIY